MRTSGPEEVARTRSQPDVAGREKIPKGFVFARSYPIAYVEAARGKV